MMNPSSVTTCKSRQWSRNDEKDHCAHKTEHRSRTQDWWHKEIAALSFSVLCLMAIVVILILINNRPLPHWHMRISPNSIVAVFSTLAKACLMYAVAQCIGQMKWLYIRQKERHINDLQMFDDASRGPLGSLMILTRSDILKSATSIGAMVTILALALDPFTQQIIAYTLRSSSIGPVSASICSATIYDTGEPITYEGSGFASSLDTAMQGAIDVGLYGLSTTFPVDCPTGDCTWSRPFTTLGVCSSYTDVTDQTARNCNDTADGLGTNNCTFTTPSGFQLPVTYKFVNAHATNPNATLPYRTMIETVTGTGSYVSMYGKSFLLRMGGITIPASASITYSGASSADNYTVWESSLYLCARKYADVSVVNGDLKSNLGINSGNLMPAFQEDYVFLSIRNNVTSDPGEGNFMANIADLSAICNYLHNLFSVNQMTSNVYASGDSATEIGNSIAMLLWSTTDPAQLMNNVAISMTNRIRIGANATQNYGEAFTNVTYVEVRWAWLSLLVITILLAISFLIMVMVANKSSSVELWKSSTMAFLFHGLSGWTEDDLAVDYCVGMTKSSKEMQGRLMRTAEGELKIVKM